MNKLADTGKKCLFTHSPIVMAAILGFIAEGFEVWHGSCALWLQEGLLLFIILLIGIKVKNRVVAYVSSALLISYYAVELYDQFVQMSVCAGFANELNPLLIIALITAIGMLDWRKCLHCSHCQNQRDSK